MSFMAVVIIQMREGERSSMGFSPESQSSHAQTSYYATATEGGWWGRQDLSGLGNLIGRRRGKMLSRRLVSLDVEKDDVT